MRKRSAAPESGAAPVDRKREFRMVASAVAAVLLLWFGIANRRTVRIEFWVHTSRVPLILVIAISGLFGALIAILALRRKSSPD